MLSYRIQCFKYVSKHVEGSCVWASLRIKEHWLVISYQVNVFVFIYLQGVKGECPQCSHSVSPEDLRPIHL